MFKYFLASIFGFLCSGSHARVVKAAVTNYSMKFYGSVSKCTYETSCDYSHSTGATAQTLVIPLANSNR
jgi:hypothetical protein